MKAKFKVGIWGQFSHGGLIADGQAVRTTIITSELKNRYGENSVTCVNTYEWYKRKIKFFAESIGLLRKAETVIVFPADNGFKVIVPLLIAANIIFRRKLLYVVIGGFLPKLLENKPVYIKMLRRFKAMFVQTENIKKDLEALGLDNILYLTNLKRITPVEKDSITENTDEFIKVCTFSRITENKGIIDAVDAVKFANATLGGNKIRIDTYGMIAENFKEPFDKLLEDNKAILEYKGIVPYDKTVDYLKDYFVLLFPTYYHGEGFPGGFIDAFNSGLPVIATDWLYNKDLIKHEENGLLVPIKDPKALSEAILRLYNDRALRRSLALNSLAKADEYKPEKVLEEFFKYTD